MAIKIDLLPEYVPLRRKLKLAVSSCVVVLGTTAAVLAVIYQKQTLELETVNQNLEMWKRVAAQSTKAKSEADAAEATGLPVKVALDFIYSASKTGPQRAALLNQVRQYIHPGSLIASIDVSDGENVNIQATVKDTDEYAAFLKTMRNGADVNRGPLYEGLPTAAGVPGFPAGEAVFVPPTADPGGQPVVMVFPLNITAQGKLKNKVVLPVDPVAPAAPPATP